ncbi:primase-helicase family protein [Rhodospira trueperi]|uniref:NrS-1 polymerase-like helicase domain-containing protein n=1 Tax=Rhodospira trueperi TaxID=69960 RepID=A0A1G7GYA1_9PROT|nr:primase-helicase family protein [Rhodospira trueperi]SDE93160.1 hypothetical protein SAMN05421720_11657 [Rhodospira trueperi]
MSEPIDFEKAKKQRRKAKSPDDDGPLHEMNERFGLVKIGAENRVVEFTTGADGKPTTAFRTTRAFREEFGNRFIPRGDAYKPIGDVWLKWSGRRTFQGITFAPQGAPDGWLNLWQGWSVAPGLGTYATFRDHLLTNACDGDEDLFRWVFAWFAQMVQEPEKKPGTALVLRGGMGTGKTIVGEIFGSLFAHHYVLVDQPKHLTGPINSHMESCLLLQADEGFWAGDKGAEGRLRGLITSARQLIERKNVDPIPLPNLTRVLITSNHDWVVPAGRDERRFAVLDVADYAKQNAEYFGAIMDEMDNQGGRAALLADLLAFDLSTVNLRAIPQTAALAEQKAASMPPIHRWWYDRLMDGVPVRALDGYGEQWGWGPYVAPIPKAVLFEDYVRASEHTGDRRRSSETQLGTELRRLVPTLEVIRTNAGGVRKWCWVLPTLEECRDHFASMYGLGNPWHPEDEEFGG